MFGAEQSSSGGGAANLSNYYTKAETTALLGNKANLSGGKLANGEVPDLAITNIVTVSNNAARDALTVQAGDCAIVSSTGLTWMYSGSAWIQIESTQVSWDNTLSSSNQTATAKFAAIDSALAAAGGGGASIDDSQKSTTTTYSSNGIDISYLSKVDTGSQSLAGKLFYDQSHTFSGINELVTKKYVDATSFTPTGTKVNYMNVMTDSNNNLVYGEVKMKDAGSGGTSLFAMSGYANDGGDIRSGRTGLGGSSNEGHYVMKKLNTDAPLAHNQSGNDVELKINFQPGTSSSNGKFLKSVLNGQPVWDTPGGSSGATSFLGLTDSPSSYGSNNSDNGMVLSVENNAIVFKNPVLVDDSGAASYISSTANVGAISLKSSFHNKTNNIIKMLKAGTNVTFSTPEDPNLIQINATASSSSGASINDSQVSTSTTYSSSKIDTTYLNKQTELFTVYRANNAQTYQTYDCSYLNEGFLWHQARYEAKPDIDDTQIVSNKVYSSTKINNDYLPRNLVFNSFRTSTGEVYCCPYLNTQLAAKLSSTVTDAQASGAKFYTESGGSLTFKRLVGGTNVTVTENATNITIDSTGGGGTSDGVLNNLSLNSNGTLTLYTSAPSTFNVSFASKKRGDIVNRFIC